MYLIKHAETIVNNQNYKRTLERTGTAFFVLFQNCKILQGKKNQKNSRCYSLNIKFYINLKKKKANKKSASI